jgi:hypothetical protein
MVEGQDHLLELVAVKAIRVMQSEPWFVDFPAPIRSLLGLKGVVVLDGDEE